MMEVKMPVTLKRPFVILREFFKTQRQTEKNGQTKKKPYSVTVVDLPNFADYDGFSLIKSLQEYADRVIFVCDLRNPYVDVKLKRMQPTLARFSVLVAPTDSVDTSVISLVQELSTNGKVLVATNDAGVVKAITASLNGQKVGFFMSDDMNVFLPVKGYEIIKRALITFHEGLVKRVLRIQADSVVKQARGTQPKDEFKAKIHELAPITLGELYALAIKSGFVKDKDHFIKCIANMAITGQIWLKNHDDINLITIYLQKGDQENNNGYGD